MPTGTGPTFSITQLARTCRQRSTGCISNGGRLPSPRVRAPLRLRLRAGRHGRSMEGEARDILRSSLSADAEGTGSLVDSIRARIEPLGGVDLARPARSRVRTPL